MTVKFLLVNKNNVETAICVVERWATVLFLYAIMHRKIIDVNFFVLFIG